jgi:peptidoglycan/LPS O-acetylase OafA/YrhL
MRRITYFDGLRGLACMQVVASHYAAAFYPAMVLQLRFLTAGSTAVAVFFLISGFVLTASFEAAAASPAILVLRRVLRLAVPAMLSVAIAAVLVCASYRNAGLAQRAYGWAGFPTPLSGLKDLAGLRDDLSGVTVLFGYRGSWPFFWNWLNDSQTTINRPLWTMSIEIWGSIWVLALVVLRRYSAWLATAVAVASLVLARDNYLILFSLGHLCARWRIASLPVDPRILSVIGIILLLEGILFSSGFHSPLYAGRENEVGATLMFVGILLLPAAQAFLNSAVPQYLGRLSFPIYLLHSPILSAAGSAIFLLALPLGHGAAVLVAFVVGTMLTFGAAAVFGAFCDAPIVRASRRLKDFGAMTRFISAMRSKTLPS